MPRYFWYHAHLARTYELLGRHGEACKQAKLLLKAYPDFEQFAYAEHRKWWWEEDLIEKAINAFRGAGLNIPPDPTKAN